MVTISERAQQLRQVQRERHLTRTERQRLQVEVEQRRRQQAQQQVQQTKQQELIQRVESARERLKGLSYSKYFAEYEKLSPEVKKYFTAPSEIRETQQYKEYAYYKKAREETEQFNFALEVYLGMRKAVAEWYTIPEHIKQRAKAVAESRERGGFITPAQYEARTGIPLSIYKEFGKIYEMKPVTQPAVTAPTYVAEKPLTAYRHVFTGEVLYQTFPLGQTPALYTPIKVSPTTLKEVALQPAYLQERQVETFKYKGVEIPVTEIYAVSKKGEVVRGATPEEQKFYREQPQVLVAPEKIKGLVGVSERLSRISEETEQQVMRGKVPVKKRVVGGLAEFALPFVALPLGAKALATQPIKTVKAMPYSIKEAGVQIGRQARTAPELALGRITGEVALAYTGGKAVSLGGKLAKKAMTRVSPKYTPITKLDVRVKGADVYGIRGRGELPDIPFAKPVKKISEPVSVQLKAFVGKEVKAVSAQTLAPVFTKKGFKFKPLEKPLYFDPRGRLRIGRIQKQPIAKISDILAGEVTFRKGKPAVLYGRFGVEKPPTKLYIKLMKGQPLTRKEMLRWQRFVETPTGKLKPTPKLTKEPEVWFPPKEIPVKEKILARAIIEKKPTAIYKLGLKKPSPKLKALLKGKVEGVDIQKLTRLIEKETGMPSPKTISTPYVSPARLGVPSVASIISKIEQQTKISKPIYKIPSAPKIPAISKIKGIMKRKPSALRFPAYKEPTIKQLMPKLPRLSYPSLRPPLIDVPSPRPVKIPELEKKRKLKKVLRRKLIPEYAYLAGFAERAVGLKAVEISERQAQQLVKKIMTGFEKRVPVKIKV